MKKAAHRAIVDFQIQRYTRRYSVAAVLTGLQRLSHRHQVTMGTACSHHVVVRE